MIIVHPRYLERFGIGSVMALAAEYGLWMVQSGNKKRLRLIPNPTKDFAK